MNTERDYHHEMAVFCSRVLPAFKQVSVPARLMVDPLSLSKILLPLVSPANSSLSSSSHSFPLPLLLSLLLLLLCPPPPSPSPTSPPTLFLLQWTEIKWEVIFSNLEELEKVSGELHTALTKTQKKEQEEEEEGEEDTGGENGVGKVFQTFAPRLRDVYAPYCRNHEQACAVMEKVRI